jgi:hypothetical protein
MIAYGCVEKRNQSHVSWHKTKSEGIKEIMVIAFHSDTIGGTIDVLDYGDNFLIRYSHVVRQNVQSGHCESILWVTVIR